MAYVPDQAVLNFYKLTPAEIKVFCFYCLKRNRTTGGWKCPDALVASEINISKNRVSEARKGLEKKGWIREMYRHFIAPIFGFDLVENSTDLVENSTDLVEFSTDLVEFSTSPLKEIPAQLPAQLPNPFTSVSAKTGKSGFANAPDEIFQKDQPAGKPGRAAPAQTKPAPRVPAKQTPADPRKEHPAVKMVKTISGRYPPKDIWDDLISEIGDQPDVEFFQASFKTWRRFNGNPQNLDGWLFAPNERGKPPERFGKNGDDGKNGEWQPDEPNEGDEPFTIKPEKLDDDKFQFALDFLRERAKCGEKLSDWQSVYTPEDWERLTENLENER